MRAALLLFGAVAALCGAGWLAQAGRTPRAAVPEPPSASPALAGPTRSPVPLENAEAPVDRSVQPEAESLSTAAETCESAFTALTGLAGDLDPAAFRLGEFEMHARAIASGLGAEGRAELLALAVDSRLQARERIACAEILRHIPDAGLPASTLQLLRESWNERERDPVLAAAAVRALGAFGDASDRSALLDASPETNALALAGLSAARGDDAALELSAVAAGNLDARRAMAGLAALCAIAASPDSGLSPAVRAQCADSIERKLADGKVTPEQRARLSGALAALDPARSVAR